MNIFLISCGCFASSIITYFLCHPMRSFKEGYDAAKEHYSDWRKGFNQGFDAAENLYTDYKRGYLDGWDAAKEGEKE